MPSRYAIRTPTIRGSGRTHGMARPGSWPTAVLVLIFAAVFAGGVRGQADGPGLATVARIECRFDVMAVGTWDDERATAELGEANLVLEFQAINADEGTAQMASDFGDFDIIVRYAEGYLHFIQSFLDGPLHSTTVLTETMPDGSWKAMHSRHEFTAFSLPGFTSSPEQYYGTCLARESGD